MSDNVLELSFKVRISDYRETQFSRSGSVGIPVIATITGSGGSPNQSTLEQRTLCRSIPVQLSGEDFIQNEYHSLIEFPFGSAMNLSYKVYACDGSRLTKPSFASAYVSIGELTHPAIINDDGTISYLFVKNDYKLLVKGQIYDTVLYVIDGKGNSSIVSKKLLRLY